ncbi:MAG: isoaspartyl peptidase/L-asparaginase, partial [Phycisphaerae bacterium]
MNDLTRRDLLKTAAAAAAAGAIAPTVNAQTRTSGHRPDTNRAIPQPENKPAAPVVVASANGLKAAQRANDMIRNGADTLDAVIAGVNIVEEDPNDHSVGYAGLPNEDGVVELDSCVMHGPTGRAGSVAALRNIKTPSRVAQTVMTRTDHVMLVGEGALRFARAHGFEEVNLLTDDARKMWLKWKERHSNKDDWIPPEVPDDDDRQSSARDDIPFTHGTINCCAVNTN